VLPELPHPLTEQRRIVARIEELAAKIEEARDLRRKASQESEMLLTSARRNSIGEEPGRDWLPLSTYVKEIENGKSPACESRPAQSDEWGVLKVGAVSFGVFNEQENKALPAHFRPQPAYEVRPGDFLMSRANTTELVGACALVQETRPKLMLSDKTFRFVFKKTEVVDIRYLDHVLKSPALRQQIEKAATGTSSTMKNISKEKVLDLLIPTNDLLEQRRIVAYLNNLQAKVDALKKLQAETAAGLDALLPSILDKAFKGEL
jgi:type I restriction enzyme S subunit